MSCDNNNIGCKGSNKNKKNGFSLSSISNILNILSTAFKLQEKPITPLPPPLLMFGAKLRPGLSPTKIASRIISRQSEAGAPVGDIFSEDNNISEAMEVIRIEEIINAIHTESKVEITIPPASIQTTSVGIGNYGAPVISQGFNNNIVSGDGVIR